MSDNLHHSSPWERHRELVKRHEAECMAELTDIASRAATKPESLSLHDVRELGWGYLQLTAKGLIQAQ